MIPIKYDEWKLSPPPEHPLTCAYSNEIIEYGEEAFILHNGDYVKVDNLEMYAFHHLVSEKVKIDKLGDPKTVKKY